MFYPMKYKDAKTSRMFGYHDAYVTVIESISICTNYSDASFLINYMLKHAYKRREDNIATDGTFDEFIYMQVYIETLSKLIEDFSWNHLATTDDNNFKDFFAITNTDIANTTEYFLERIL